jgi:hypothetical protein
MPGELIKKFVEAAGPYSKRGLELLTALFIFIFASVFCHVFILSLAVFDSWPGWLIYGGCSVILYSLVVFIFSSDALYYDDPKKNKYARAFQLYSPSTYISEKFGISVEDARYYWFENYFNVWRKNGHPRHNQWERTLRRGYSCRFVYYCIRCLEILLILSVFFIFGQELPHRLFEVRILRTDSSLLVRIAFVVFLTLIYFVIRVKNRTKPERISGVWKHFAEINKMHRKWIDENIHSLGELKLT